MTIASVNQSPRKVSRSAMEAGRLEAFSDGVIAVIITIMVLELKAPEGPHFGELLARWHIFASYVASFTFVAIYWVNHHHLLHVARRISAPTMWLNIHWLFWLSLYPFVTSYVGNTKGSPISVAAYGAIAAATALAYGLLARDLTSRNAEIIVIAKTSYRRTIMNVLSVVANLVAIPIALWSVPTALVLLAVPALIHFMPDAAAEV